MRQSFLKCALELFNQKGTPISHNSDEVFLLNTSLKGTLCVIEKKNSDTEKQLPNICCY